MRSFIPNSFNCPFVSHYVLLLSTAENYQRFVFFESPISTSGSRLQTKEVITENFCVSRTLDRPRKIHAPFFYTKEFSQPAFAAPKLAQRIFFFSKIPRKLQLTFNTEYVIILNWFIKKWEVFAQKETIMIWTSQVCFSLWKFEYSRSFNLAVGDSFFENFAIFW